MVETVRLYRCSVCMATYEEAALAGGCERSGCPKPIGVRPGDQVRLRNRGRGTYTVASVLRLSVGNLRGVGVGLVAEHRWILKLDRAVFLDRAWDGESDEVLDIYLVPDAEAATMERNDNDCGR